MTMPHLTPSAGRTLDDMECDSLAGFSIAKVLILDESCRHPEACSSPGDLHLGLYEPAQRPWPSRASTGQSAGPAAGPIGLITEIVARLEKEINVPAFDQTVDIPDLVNIIVQGGEAERQA